MGRLDKYQTHVLPHISEIPKLYETMTEYQIAKRLGVSVKSFENYKKKYPELQDALRKGKEVLIDELKDTLKMKARGFNYTETKTTTTTNAEGERTTKKEVFEKYAQPDTGAIHLLLKNLDEDWHNEDYKTLKMKQEQLKIAKQKAEGETW